MSENNGRRSPRTVIDSWEPAPWSRPVRARRVNVGAFHYVAYDPVPIDFIWIRHQDGLQCYNLYETKLRINWLIAHDRLRVNIHGTIMVDFLERIMRGEVTLTGNEGAWYSLSERHGRFVTMQEWFGIHGVVATSPTTFNDVTHIRATDVDRNDVLMNLNIGEWAVEEAEEESEDDEEGEFSWL